jgi:hypothetical protein
MVKQLAAHRYTSFMNMEGRALTCDCGLPHVIVLLPQDLQIFISSDVADTREKARLLPKTKNSRVLQQRR